MQRKWLQSAAMLLNALKNSSDWRTRPRRKQAS